MDNLKLVLKSLSGAGQARSKRISERVKQIS